MLKYILKINVLFILSVYILISCQYDGGDDNFHTVQQSADDFIEVKLELAGYKFKDTIDILEDVRIPFQVTVSSGNIKNLRFSLDTTTLKSDTLKFDTDSRKEMEGEIIVDWVSNTTKVYRLNFDLWVSTTTGSLADIKEREGVNLKDSILLYLKFVNPE